MSVIRLSKEFTFDMAHALLGYDGLCRNIHGHTYTLRVNLKGIPLNDRSSPKNGMLIDFKDLKNIIKDAVIDQLDHALMLNKDTPAEVTEILKKNYENVVLVDYQPTTENIIADLADKIIGLLPSHLQLYSLLLRETPSSYAEWYAEDQENI